MTTTDEALEPDTEEQLIAKAAQLSTLLAEHADEASQLTRPADTVIEALRDAGMFKLTTPRSRGGYQVSLQTFIRIGEELARGCASTSWVTSIYNGGIYMSCTFPDRALDEVFADGAPLMCSNFTPSGQAIPTDGGYRITASWRFCSGQHHADWGLMASMIVRDGQDPEPATFIIRRSDMVAADDWHVSGLRGSGSNTLSVEDLFVPEHMVQPIAVAAMAETRSESLASDSYFKVPHIPFFTAGATGAPLGMARAAMDLFASRIHKRGITYTTYAKQSDAVVTHLQMDEAIMKIDEARFHAERAVETALKVSENLADVASRVRIRSDAAWCFRRSREAIEVIRQAAGASALTLSNPMGRIVDDIEALTVHSFLVFSTNSELHGRVRCGLAPDVPFF
ncbi:acyl-CoA dehydrogenase, C-terminal domain protein [Mycobacterium parascrofulaceum ATCC BAA-614]|uniref:Acyl-CoA dehydrogenase, C-terminal domain protein n=1 Tax=Mycobacterium parascrofulaceum ATCC BAA-614 TaxID=525368 RepID=D5P5X3_9MYCO|nr:acyl-CoA dehydrogenase family protein [Mycobacterium parascrofulaceum]EFG78527.1 acyl-CoA dehydrogenase, C-terminal domain protein [Mycobacterium parascrofulaceum ATCC BAA-614]